LTGITLYTRAHFVYVPASTSTASTQDSRPNGPGFGHGEFAWPQIDNPNADQAAWNTALLAAATKIEGAMMEGASSSFDQAVSPGDDIDGFFFLKSANQHLIDVALCQFAYTGGAHGMTGCTAFIWWLGEHRTLAAEDVFAAGSPWQEKLAAITQAKLLSDPGADALWPLDPAKNKYGLPDLRKSVAQGAINPSHWDISSEGLNINFGEYEVGPYSSGMPSAHIAWSELQGFLNPSLRPETLPPAILQPK
jgi:hypothetical protein